MGTIPITCRNKFAASGKDQSLSPQKRSQRITDNDRVTIEKQSRAEQTDTD